MVLQFYNKYEFVENIGTGGNAVVFSCKLKDNSDGKIVAVKKIIKNRVHTLLKDSEYGIIPIEVYILKNYSHNNIITFHEYICTSYYHFIIMEKFGTTDLFELLVQHEINEVLAKVIFNHVLDALMYLFKFGIVHGDVKSENILIDTRDYNVKLIDFGSAIQIADGNIMKHDYLGTIEYHPPEMIVNPEKAQVWSLGVLLYDILYKRIPFKNNDYKKPNFSFRCDISQSTIIFISTLLEINPDLRPGMYDLLFPGIQQVMYSQS